MRVYPEYVLCIALVGLPEPCLSSYLHFIYLIHSNDSNPSYLHYLLLPICIPSPYLYIPIYIPPKAATPPAIAARWVCLCSNCSVRGYIYTRIYVYMFMCVYTIYVCVLIYKIRIRLCVTPVCTSVFAKECVYVDTNLTPHLLYPTSTPKTRRRLPPRIRCANRGV